jgi:hypothetical protein
MRKKASPMATPHNELVAALMEDRPRLASELYHATYGPDLPDHDAITIKRLQVGPPETAIRRMCVLAVYSMRGEATLGVLFDMVTAPDPGQAAAWLWFIQSAQRAVACAPGQPGPATGPARVFPRPKNARCGTTAFAACGSGYAGPFCRQWLG